MAAKIKKGDQVIVITGKYKGRTGTVLRLVEDGKRVYVEGVNLVKKHTRPNPNANQPGGIIEKEAPFDISNVAIYNPKTQKADRVGFKTVGEGDDTRKVRVFKSDNEQIDI